MSKIGSMLRVLRREATAKFKPVANVSTMVNPSTKPAVSKVARVVAKATAATVVATGTAVAFNRWQRKQGDFVPNPDNTEFRRYLEEQRKLGNDTAEPWVTTDPEVLAKLKYLPEIVIPDPKSMKMLTHTVIVKPLSECPYKDDVAKPIKNIVVGGPPAAMVAMQTAIDGEPGLYVNYTKDVVAISDGSALHGEPQRAIDGPAYEGGSTPIKFLTDEAKEFVSPPRYSDEVIKPNLRWKKLGVSEWVTHPGQWWEGMGVAAGNQRIAWRYATAKKEGKPTGTEYFTEEIQKSGDYIKDLDAYLRNRGNAPIIQPRRDSLLVTRTDADEKAAEADAAALDQEGCKLIKLTAEECKAEFNFVPRNAKGYWKKVGDFSFRKDFMKNLTTAITEHGYEVHNDWQLREVYHDEGKKFGWAVFAEQTPEGEKLHPRKFENLHTSLGTATYSDAPVPLASVAGVSCQGFHENIELKAGNSWVLGDTNHHTLTGDTRDGGINAKTGKAERLTPQQYTNSARVKPRDMGSDFAKFDARYALHLDESLRTSLPEGASFKPVFCRACPRQMGPNGLPTRHTKGNWSRYMEGGGAYLTQAGKSARQVAKNPENPIPVTSVATASLPKPKGP